MFGALADTNLVSLELPAARLATTRQQARPSAIHSVPCHPNASRSVCESGRQCVRAAVAWSSSNRLQPPVGAIVELVPDRLRQKARATHHHQSSKVHAAACGCSFSPPLFVLLCLLPCSLNTTLQLARHSQLT
jgi:hypothetical protein